ncbi:uncharacterized protein LOC18427756 isoform X2 [Amborella trichopoda]|uniref:uncharacterized protein LOC18427756 isoform X2 n=1 Tax=Amborella trichopoda TaxID=13333 RepID=UPI0009C02A90|nr:uncharacterized protein LOC18427756 isoform X2 [Amborella trichopoda]|eukprot:XP_020519023.1 uncharacterized protein LOC18427756 isoform X2 [Amborella trichopoda]
MTIRSDPLRSKISWKGRSSGWAAFDRKQREARGDLPKIEADPYPPMPHSSSSSSITQSKKIIRTYDNGDNMGYGNPRAASLIPSIIVLKDFSPQKSFSSVLKPSTDSDSSINNSKLRGQTTEETSNEVVIENLKKQYGWADLSLIGDVLVAVNYDKDQACTLLESMEYQPRKSEESKEESIDPTGGLCERMECVELGKPLALDSNSDLCRTPAMRSVLSAPVEPEWEEDDVYLTHRKDAIRTVRVASQHSRAASNAYLRGDHHVAQQLSSKANKEWLKAEQLNAKAAEEILRIRNSENDMWKLDLHGLHASEAVHALEIHLKRIETQLMKSKNSLSYDAITSLIEGKEGPSFAGNVDGLDGVKGGDETSLPVLPLPRPSQTLLQVITGMETTQLISCAVLLTCNRVWTCG